MSVWHGEWLDGYECGQDDFLKALKQAPLKHDEPVYVALHERLHWRYSVWCLAHNLAAAASLRVARENGWWDGAGYHRGCP